MTNFVETILEEGRESHLNNEEKVLDNPETKIGEGLRKHVHKSHLGYIIKVFKDDPRGEFLKDIQELTENNNYFLWSEVAEVPNYGNSDFVIRQGPADLTHQQTVNKIGLERTMQKEIQMLLDLNQQSITYKDFKPANIAYEGLNNSFEPRAIDVFDRYALEEGKFDKSELRKTLEFYVHGKFSNKGVIDVYDIEPIEAEYSVGEALLNYHGFHEEKKDYLIMNAIRKI